MYLCIYVCTCIYTQSPGVARVARVEGPHSQSNVVATLHSAGKINKGIMEY